MTSKYLLIHSFYNRALPEGYVLNGKGLGFLSLFALAALTALVFAVKLAFVASEISPTEIKTFTDNLPEIKIVDGNITEPKDFFRRIPLNDSVNLTLDTTENGALPPVFPANSEIYISKNAVHFVNGNRIELMPLSKLLNGQNVTLTKENIHTFATNFLKNLRFAVPFAVFIIVLPMYFFKYVFLTYCLALTTYVLTLYPRVPLAFEQRMRLSVISCLPVFVLNYIFDTLLSWFSLGAAGGVLVAFVYLYYYLSLLPEEVTVNDDIETPA